MPGSITFRPLEANLTHNTEWIGKMDPYVQFLVGKHKVRTNVCRKGGKNPMWDDNVTVPITGDGMCLVELKDKDLIKDDRIGSFEVNLNEVESQGTVKKWFPIFHRDKPAGEILMEATYSPEGLFNNQYQPTEGSLMGAAPIVGTTPLMGSTSYMGGAPLTTSVPVLNQGNVPLMNQGGLPLQTPGLTPSQGSKSLSEQYAEEALLRSIDPLHSHSANLTYNLPTGAGPINDAQKNIPVNSGYMGGSTLGQKATSLINNNAIPTQHNQFVPVGTGLGADYMTNNVTQISNPQQVPFGHSQHGGLPTVVKESLNATTQGPKGTANAETFDRNVKNI